MSTHYSLAQKPQKLLEAAITISETIVKKFADTNDILRPMLVYRGFSGVSLATAISLQLPEDFTYAMVYVRKPEEVSHGRNIEFSLVNQPDDEYDQYNIEYVPVFVDDFISSGETLVKTLVTLYERIRSVVNCSFSIDESFPEELPLVKDKTQIMCALTRPPADVLNAHLTEDLDDLRRERDITRLDDFVTLNDLLTLSSFMSLFQEAKLRDFVENED